MLDQEQIERETPPTGQDEGVSWEALGGALAILTVLPARRLLKERGRIFVFFPVVGLVIGFLLAALAANEALTTGVRALTVLVGWIIITGGLHLDGLGDFLDGVLTRRSPQRRLTIMQDPRTGKLGAIGLVVVLLAKWVLIQDVTPFLLIVPPVLGRWAMVLAAYAFLYRRESGGEGFFSYGLSRRDALIASAQVIVFLLPALLLFGSTTALALLLTPVLVLVLGHWTAARLGGGLTGDVHGAMCELTEVVCLYCLAA